MDLVCDDKWLPALCTTLFYTGSLFGNLLFGWIADKYVCFEPAIVTCAANESTSVRKDVLCFSGHGARPMVEHCVTTLWNSLLNYFRRCRWGRRISFLLMIYVAVTLSIGTAFSPNYNVYMVFRTINGLTFPALFQIPYILG